MSQDFMDAELFADFIIEAKEHLETIEPNLLELEKAPDNLGLLNEIFRPMHSLKGASGFLGLNKMNMLAHRCENILDELRKGDMVVTSEIMDIILASTDALRQMIDNLESTNTEGEVETEHLKSQIDAIMAGETLAPAQAAPSDASEEAPESAAEELEPAAAEEAVEPDGAAAEEPAAPEESVAAEEPATPEESVVSEEPAVAGEAVAPADVQAPSAAEEPEPAAVVEAAAPADDQALGDAPQEPAPVEPAASAAPVKSVASEEPATAAEAAAPADDQAPSDAPEPQQAAPAEPDQSPVASPAVQKPVAPAVPAMSGKQWIQTLSLQPDYKLTAFGETHLRDFVDEAREIIDNLVTGLVSLEDHSEGQDDLINDLFRYFHNLKGNSGIIAYLELNSLTHEAETLLNNVRRGEMAPSHELTDLLLLCVDMMEALVNCIDIPSSSVGPFDISEALHQLQEAVAGREIALPAALREAPPSAAEAAGASDTPMPTIIPMGNEDDLAAFRNTVHQQSEIFHTACALLAKNSGDKESINALYRSLVAVDHACGFMKLAEAKIYAERTAAIVDKARSTNLDFGLLLDLLNQEFGIILEVIEKGCAKLAGDAPDAAPAAAKPVSPAAAAPKPAAKPAPADAEKPTPPAAAAPKPAAKPAPADAEKPTPPAAAAASKPAAKAAASPAPPPAAKPSPPPAPPAKPPAPPSSPAAAPAAAAGAHDSKASSTIRVDHEKLDHLMNLIGELIINRNRYSLIARQLEDGGEETNINEVAQSLSETTYAMARISDDLQDTIMKVRMVPVSSVFSRFPRLVRDLSRKSGKDVDLVVEGDETELDKSVVEVIGDPLVHLIRNSVDHGVEHEATRIARGKPAKGRVVLRAYHKGNSVAIEIEDDGNGIDPEKMREVAVRKGLISAEEAKQLDDREAMELIFAPGFSSAETITDISGRGVGMDVVRTNIKNLKGSVSISSEVGKGTRFTLALPLTLAIIDALMIDVSGEMFAIPLDAVSETTKIESVRLTEVKGRKAVTLRGEVLGIVELAEMLALPKSYKELPEVLSIVVIHDNDRRLGLVVDRLMERQEIVIKPLGAYLGDLKGISGATIMGDGSVILILDPHEIYLMATSKGLG